MNRRGLMKMMGLGAVAAPIAAPHIGAMPAAGSELAGIASAGFSYGGPTESGWGGPVSPRSISKQALKAIGIPGWLTKEWDRNSRYVVAFDPDIASYRFMSLPAKLALQRKRNRERVEAEWWRPSPWREQQKWHEQHGHFED